MNQGPPQPPAAHRQLAKPHNIPMPVLAMTTADAASGVEEMDGGLEKIGSGGVEEFTTIGGMGYRLPLTTEKYVVEVRQVVSTKSEGDT